MKNIDLKPDEYRTTRGVKGEPFFGAGWPFGAAALSTIAVGTLSHEASWPVYLISGIAAAALTAVWQQFYR